MSSIKEAAVKTATEDRQSFALNDIIYTDSSDRVTIEITGRAFANLKEITEITNKWADDDYTPTDILRVFCFHTTFLNLYKKYDENSESGWIQTLPGAIAEQMVDGEELKILFEAAGFSTYF